MNILNLKKNAYKVSKKPWFTNDLKLKRLSRLRTYSRHWAIKEEFTIVGMIKGTVRYDYRDIKIKGTVRVISSDPPCTE